MKTKSLIIALAMCLGIGTQAYAGSGSTCDDAIVVTQGYSLYVPIAGTYWFTANTSELPLTIDFYPTSDATGVPTAELDFRCGDGDYPTEQLQKFFKGNGSGAYIPMPAALNFTKQNTHYQLSVPRRYRDYMMMVGLMDDVQAYVKVTFPCKGDVTANPDDSFSKCFNNGDMLNLGSTRNISANDADTYFIFPYSLWNTEDIQYVWNGSEELHVWLSNTCDFAPGKTNPNYLDDFVIPAGGIYKMSKQDIVKKISEYQPNFDKTDGMFYARMVSTSSGKFKVEKQPAKPTQNDAILLEKDVPVDADSSRLYCFPKTWAGNIKFTSPTKNILTAYFNTTGFFTIPEDTATVKKSCRFSATEDGRELDLSNKEVTDLTKLATDANNPYIYVRFNTIAHTQVTVSDWGGAGCDVAQLRDGDVVKTTGGVYTYQFRMSYNDLQKGGNWTFSNSSSTAITINFATMCLTNSSVTGDLKKVTNVKKGSPAVITSDEIEGWEDQISEDGFVYLCYYQRSGSIQVNASKQEEEPEPDALEVITKANVGDYYVHTGVKEGLTINGSFQGKDNRKVVLANTFDAEGNPLFDQLYIFGETSTADDAPITSPTSTAGSNAQTPCYIYRATEKSYVLEETISNVNTENRIANKQTSPGTLRTYITGFCPYASTGYLSTDEGVFYFGGAAGASIDIYLEDAFIYSRNKTENGCRMTPGNTQPFDKDWVCGSGAVFVLECSETTNNSANPMRATIHTRGQNLLMSNNGCYYSYMSRSATQMSSPVQIRMNSDAAINNYTELTFDDKWPMSAADYTLYTRTNGFVSLRKQSNNAPSIDMGNTHTVVNFRGGQVELQNAQIESPNYKTTLAISHRAGNTAYGKVLPLGMGTDETSGTVNFYDGTTTVIPMTVSADNQIYYLMDEDANGVATNVTSCLRCPKNTYIYGGSHMMMRACQSVESKGGAPTDGVSVLGIHKYTMQEGDIKETSTGRIALAPKNFLDGIAKNDDPTYTLRKYYDDNSMNYYGAESVTDIDGTVNLWIPNGFGTAVAEEDTKVEYWKACLTRIEASYPGLGTKAIGGDATFTNSQVENLLYCVIDDNIHDVISAPGYEAPVKNPGSTGYEGLPPQFVGDDKQHYITNTGNYQVESGAYYMTTIPSANKWMNITAPFDVKKISVIEINESALTGTKEQNLQQQATWNADMAAFYAVAMAMGNNQSFWSIFADYKTYAKSVGMTAKQVTLTNGTNMTLQQIGNNWTYNGKNFATNNSAATPNADGVIMQKGQNYALMLNSAATDENEWDYWSGKFIILEGEGQLIMDGSDAIKVEKDLTTANSAIIAGNQTLQKTTFTGKSNCYYWDNEEGKYLTAADENVELQPTQQVMYANITVPASAPAEVFAILPDGKVQYYIEVGDDFAVVEATEDGYPYPYRDSENDYEWTGNGIQYQVAQKDIVVKEGEDFTLTSNTTAQTITLAANTNASGQIHLNGFTLSLLQDGEAYFDYTFGATAMTWYAVAMPWQVDAVNGISVNGSHLILGTDIDILRYDPAIRAANGANKSAWKFIEFDADKTLKPGVLYMVRFAVDQASPIRFAKKSGSELIYSQDLEVNLYPESTGDTKDANWNPIANPGLCYAKLNAGITTGQVYVAGDDRYDVVTLSGYPFPVGKPVFVQATAQQIVGVIPATVAPVSARGNDTNDAYELNIRNAGSENYSDRLFICTSDDKANEYTIGSDLQKIGISSKVAQMWIDAYDAQLCKYEALQNSNGESTCKLGIRIPKAGMYEIYLSNAPQNETDIYLTWQGKDICLLSEQGFVANLDANNISGYGIRLAPKKVSTAIRTNSDGKKAEKFIQNGVLYLRNGKQLMDAQGRIVK